MSTSKRIRLIGILPTNTPSTNFIPAIKILREVLGLGLREAKWMVDDRAGVIEIGDVKETLERRLSQIGVTVEWTDDPTNEGDKERGKIRQILLCAESDPEHAEEFVRLAAIRFCRFTGKTIMNDVLGGQEPWMIKVGSEWERFSNLRLAHYIRNNLVW